MASLVAATTTGQQGPTKLDLAMQKAASDLAKAAVESADMLTAASLRELEQIRASTAKALVFAEQTKTAVETAAKVDAASLLAVKASVDMLSTTMIESEKMQQLRWAFDNATHGEFACGDAPDGRAGMKAGGFVQQILLTFMKGDGKYLTGFVHNHNSGGYSYGNDPAKVAAAKKEFENLLVAQLTALLGQAPRVTDSGTPPKRAIFYD